MLHSVDSYSGGNALVLIANYHVFNNIYGHLIRKSLTQCDDGIFPTSLIL